MKKRLHPVLKAALWGAGVATVLSLSMQAADRVWPGDVGWLFVMDRPRDLLEEALGVPPRLNGPWAEIYLLPFAVNAAIGALVFALPVAFLEAVDYLTKPAAK